jgi:hypothetical protein
MADRVSSPDTRPTPELAIAVDKVGWLSFAQPQATERLWTGLDSSLVEQLQRKLTAAEFKKVVEIWSQGNNIRAPAVSSMPLADAIQLAQFMVDVTSGYTHFLLGPNTVGGPTEVASMNRHEGFKWIARKYYYDARINPREPGHVS